MKFIAVVLFAVVAAVAAESETVRFESEVNADSFHYGYETSDGIYVKAGGELKDVGSEKALVQQGEFSYNDSEGRKITVKYVADEMGFHPEGEHLPVDHPVPKHIVRALEWIKTHPMPEHAAH